MPASIASAYPNASIARLSNVGGVGDVFFVEVNAGKFFAFDRTGGRLAIGGTYAGGPTVHWFGVDGSALACGYPGSVVTGDDDDSAGDDDDNR